MADQRRSTPLGAEALGRMNATLYYLGLASLFTHELDAVTHSEWELLPILKGLSDAVAAPFFLALHVPLFFAILLLSHHANRAVRETSRTVVAGFLVLHAVLHFSLSSTAGYGFNGALSRTLVFSAGGFGLAYLLIKRRRRNPAGAPPAMRTSP